MTADTGDSDSELSSLPANIPERETKVYINVSAEVNITYESTLSRFPDTLLGDPNVSFTCKRSISPLT